MRIASCLIVAALAACPRAASGGVLGRIPAGEPGLAYEIAIAACRGDRCPIEIRLVRGRDVLDRARTGRSATSARAEPEKVLPGWGAGDPLTAPPGLTAWATGEEEGHVAIAARPIALDAGVHGVLIDTQAGFDHLKRQHEIWIARAGRLRRAWTHDEGAGPTWSSTAIAANARGFEDLVLFDAFSRDAMDEPDRLDVTALTWKSGALRPRPPPPVWASVIGRFDAAISARNAIEASAACLAGYRVIPGRRFGLPARNVLAVPSLSRAAAQRAAARAGKCRSTVRARVARLIRPAE